ncbi:Rha family transcriptional regulator [Cronobacter sakazakii]|uniref:transcriptional regulator n=1 Tax=Cronobacter TaxID=413496 RepID=UPI000A11D612|nr:MULTISPECIES: YdaS family helix-turn-helix protein [Cronobacter]EJH4501927.1 helix-turn-helix domain-containing protein [Cronobacter sakazakii]EJV9474177.1 helix-turn-helix domain-containing protein [Cronobacter sakazakii]ELY2773098.1 helix-turn-helix domain-containing protein [Cronobacter sakazakii]ELY6360332.1 helix-turn-helix domain-containing protein [Cronobacter sakazakii]NCH41220.1 Rha family transcriptional regulator [Cronobacter sakazakii]
MKTALEKAVAAAGNDARLARGIGLSPMAISHWRKRNKGIIPNGRVMDVYKATGIPPHELRPDLYPPELYSGSGSEASAVEKNNTPSDRELNHENQA